MPDISKILLQWYARHARELPWRETRDPYRIWISEIILQQTRVAQGTEYYLRFTARFPDVASLAAAPIDEVLKYWQGLGYYSRARNLHAAAQDIVERFGGTFPHKYQEVRSLRGIGDYTAAAICSIAYGEPVAVVDGNVFRVLARLFDIPDPIDSVGGKRRFTALAGELLDIRQPGTYNQAIMDFGALQCTPGQPDCTACPLHDQCRALTAETISQRPVKGKRTAVTSRYFNYLHITCGERTWLRRREGKDIWQGLYEFPLVETEIPVPAEELRSDPRFHSLVKGGEGIEILGISPLKKHLLSHRALHMRFYTIRIAKPPLAMSEYLPVEEKDLGLYAVPRPVEEYLKDSADKGTHGRK